MKTSIILTPLLVFASISIAQERTASGVIETQMSWTALSAKADAAKFAAEAVDIRMNQVAACGRKGLLYAPGGVGIDGEGCVVSKLDPNHINTLNNLSSNVNNVLACNNAGQIYNGNTRSCNSVISKPSCRIHSFDAPLDRSNGSHTCPGDTTRVISRVSAYGFSCGGDNGDPSSCLINHALCLKIICD